MPEHLRRRQVVRKLVDGGGREAVGRPERLEERPRVEHRPQVVDVGIAEVDGDRRTSVLGLDRADPRRDLVERGLPAHLLPAARGATEWMPQPVGVALEVLEGDGLGADVTV